MPWTSKQAAALFKPNAATVTAAEYAGRLASCAACEQRAGKRCQLAYESVNVLCRYPRFQCPAGRFPAAKKVERLPAATPEAAAVAGNLVPSPEAAAGDGKLLASPESAAGTSGRIVSGMTEIPAGERPAYACDVVIPFYRGVKWLGQAIDSILAQRFADVRIHVIDDHSPEVAAAAAVRAQYAGFENVLWSQNAVNIGPYASVHRVWDRMRSGYFAVQDADDVAFPNRLWRAIHALETTGREIYGAAMEQFLDPSSSPSDYNAQYVEGRPVHRSGEPGHYAPFGNLVNGTMVLRRETFERLNGFANEFCGCDMEFINRAHYAGATFFIDEAVVGLRRLHSTSLSRGGEFGMQSENRQRIQAEWDRRYLEYRVEGDKCDFAAYGTLRKRWRRELIACRALEVHATHACNLACESCSHLSNHGHKGHLSPDVAREWFLAWSRRLRPKRFAILGGEPTLNPQLVELVTLAGEYWRESEILLVTNGFNLHRFPGLPAALAAAQAELNISVHHGSADYEAKLRPVRELVAEWQAVHGIKVKWRASAEKWRRTWRADGLPYADGDIEGSWEACRSKWCLQLHRGKLWKCPQLAYLPLQNERYGLGEEWAPYLKYEPLASDCSAEALAEFVNRRAEAACAMCPANVELFELDNPLVNSANR